VAELSVAEGEILTNAEAVVVAVAAPISEEQLEAMVAEAAAPAEEEEAVPEEEAEAVPEEEAEAEAGAEPEAAGGEGEPGQEEAKPEGE
jgi:hypothetical protein